MDKKLEEELRASVTDNHLPCATAWDIAQKLKVSRRQVGDSSDELKMRIVDCQLGCFQVRKATHEDIVNLQPARPLVEQIQASLVDGNLPCAVAFKVARKLEASPKEVGDAATRMKVHIVDCQLGCF